MMNKIILAFIFITALAACNEKRNQNGISTKPPGAAKDSIDKKRSIDSQFVKSSQSDDDDPTPTYDEVMNEWLSFYKKIESIDKVIIDGSDSLQLHLKYYCLHDSTLTVPKIYMSAWGKEYAKDFVTHNFASKITIVKNRDTVLNRVFKKSDFGGILRDQLKKYAVPLGPCYLGYDKAQGKLAIGYSISIPMTDIGVPGSIVIDKKGGYKILDEYAKMDAFKE